MMTLKTLLKRIRKDHETLMEKAHNELRAGDCFLNYAFEYKNMNYEIRMNLLTLDFTTHTKMPVSLRSKIKYKMIKEEYLKWKFKKEGRAFFDFLRLYFDNFDDIRFTDCESPDFIIHNSKEHGYEVTEATDAHNAKFNEAVYMLTGMDYTTKEYQFYLKHIEMSLKNKRSGDHVKKKVYEFDIHDKIIRCIEKKALKYKEYDVSLDTKNVIIFNNRIAFRRQSDFDYISTNIQNNEIINNSDLDKIFIISGTHDVMIQLNKHGHIENIRRRKHNH